MRTTLKSERTSRVLDKYMEDFVASLETNIKELEAHLTTFTPEVLKDEEERHAFVVLMSVYQNHQSLIEGIKEALKRTKEDNEKEKSGKISDFGFLSDIEKEAA